MVYLDGPSYVFITAELADTSIAFALDVVHLTTIHLFFIAFSHCSSSFTSLHGLSLAAVQYPGPFSSLFSLAHTHFS